MGVVGGALISTLSLSVFVSSAAQASGTTESGASLLRASEAAVDHEHSVHVAAFQSGINVSAKTNVNATVTIVTDAGTSEGIQRVTYGQRGTSGRETVEVIGGNA